MTRKILLVSFIVIFLGGLSSCLTYYQLNLQFERAFEQGRIEEADRLLAGNKKMKRKRELVLYNLNRGTTLSLLGNYDSSNVYFEQAYRMADEYHVNYGNEALALLTNPNATEYRLENNEVLMNLYYKALNYLKLGDKEAALVECKRLNIKLNQLSDKYKSDKKFKRDAFIHLLMGLIYDANYDYNNAFIAYRNAYEIYSDDYAKLFGMAAPDQLKQDLIRTAYQTGFKQDAQRYEKQFGLKYKPLAKGTGDVIFLWHNGLGPIKSEWSINFNIVRGQGGQVVFANEQLGFNFPFFLEEQDKDKSKGLAALEFIRVAFPKYVERPLIFGQASLSANNQTFNLQLLENVNAVSVRCLQDRMLFEMGKSLLRMGLKKVSEYELRKKNDGVGAAIGMFNALTEKADTRNWQTVPHSIYYARVTLPKGQQKVTFSAQNRRGGQPFTREFNFDVPDNGMIFHTHQNLDFVPTFYTNNP